MTYKKVDYRGTVHISTGNKTLCGKVTESGTTKDNVQCSKCLSIYKKEELKDTKSLIKAGALSSN